MFRDGKSDVGDRGDVRLLQQILRVSCHLFRLLNLFLPKMRRGRIECAVALQ